MRRLLWIPWPWWRRATQLALLLLFLWLFRRTEYSGSDQLAGGENLFFRLDPLAALAAMLGTRQWIFAFWPALAVVILTTLLGRFFCGWVCPLGTLLDGFHRLFRPLSRRTNVLCQNMPAASERRLRLIPHVLLLVVLTAALFALPLVGFVDPFAILTRGLVFWGDPLFFRTTDAALSWWGNEAVRSFVREKLLPYRAAVFQFASVSAAILLALFALELVGRRFWCRYLCPLGAMLAWCGRRPLLLRRMPKKVCATCGLCASDCRFGAFSAGGDFLPGNCNLCFACVDFCPNGIVSYGFRGARGSSRAVPVDMSRRVAIGALAAGAALPGMLAAKRFVRPKKVDPFLLRPPGAADEKTFLNLCIRCGECMKVCPTGVLQPAGLASGIEGIFSPRLMPRLIFEQTYCEYACTLCGQVCPTGAIPLLDEQAKHAHPIGKAYFDHALCLPWAKQTPCIRCEEMCPVPEKAIKIVRTFTVKGVDGTELEIQQPVVERELCVGCGICESNCPLEGPAGIRVYRLDAPPQETEFLLDEISKGGGKPPSTTGQGD